jgi:hypothetical protein
MFDRDAIVVEGPRRYESALLKPEVKAAAP